MPGLVTSSISWQDRRRWETPRYVMDYLVRRFGEFTLDPCSSESNRKASRFFTEGEDGLSMPWYVRSRDSSVIQRAFVNPPYNNGEAPCKPNCAKKVCRERGWHTDKGIPGLSAWVGKCYEEAKKGMDVVALLPANTGTRWAGTYFPLAESVIFSIGRIPFELDGVPGNSSSIESVIVHWAAGGSSGSGRLSVEWADLTGREVAWPEAATG